MKQKRPFRFAKTSCAIASILVVSTLTGIFLAGCESPSSESMPSTASSETESHASSLTSSQVSFAAKSVSELASYEDVPFQITNSTDHTPVNFLSFPEYWGNIVICGTDHQYAFRQMFSDSESHPTAIPDQTVLTVSFGAYAPKTVTVHRDANTYNKPENVDTVPTETVTTNRSLDHQYSFSVDYRGESVLYYVISATWENGNHVDYAIAITPK